MNELYKKLFGPRSDCYAWAEEFSKSAIEARKEGRFDPFTDIDFLAGWMANAMQKGRWEENREILNKIAGYDICPVPEDRE